MKIKSFLVGCVGSFIALTSAQAEKPVEYVKICSLYGAGFYYIPGTDTCIKIGGYVRAQGEYQSINGLSYGSTNGVSNQTTTNGGTRGPSTIDDGAFNRRTNSINFVPSGVIGADARTQTEYGTVRSYIRVGLEPTSSTPNAANQFLVDRAFIQYAGFTGGIAQSFFDVFTTTERYTYTNVKTSGDTYKYGIPLFGYTAGFGNGFSATVAAEIPHYPAGVIDGASTGFGQNGATGTDTAGLNMPDFVGNLRIDQAWGMVGISGAVHRVAGQYYGSSNAEVNGHPSDKYGWAATIGGQLNLPWNDTIGASFVGTKGALGYATKAGSWQMYSGNSVGLGWVSDGIFDNTNPGITGLGLHLTNAWSVNAAYEHRWNRQWQTSVYGGYTKIWYDAGAKDLINIHLPTPSTGGLACGVPVAGSVWPLIALDRGQSNSCSPDFSFYQIGTRTQWNISSTFYVGLDVTYTRLNTAYAGGTVAPNSFLYQASSSHSAVGEISNQGTWSGILRVQRDFYP